MCTKHGCEDESYVVELLYSEEVQISGSSIFPARTYLRHGGCGKRDCHGLRYRTYLFSTRCDLTGALAFAVRERFPVQKFPVVDSGKDRDEQDSAGSNKNNRLTKKKTKRYVSQQGVRVLVRLATKTELLLEYVRPS